MNADQVVGLAIIVLAAALVAFDITTRILVRVDVGPVQPDRDLTALAEATGVLVAPADPDEPIAYVLAGEQPRVEFTAGPSGFGPLWRDDHLAEVVGRWSTEGGLA